jgi:7-keto-8-aminopelargonate synthetase-like enzyme
LIASKEGETLRANLLKNINALAPNHNPATAIIPIILGSEERALAAADKLKHEGFLIPAIRYPTVPRAKARLRVTLSAAHTPQQIAKLTEALAAL